MDLQNIHDEESCRDQQLNSHHHGLMVMEADAT